MLDVMLYENKPVYIGVSLAVAGQIMVPSSSTQSPAAYGSPRGHSNQGQNGGSADAGRSILVKLKEGYILMRI